MGNTETIRICDCTLRQGEKSPQLSFRETIELCRLLDKLGIDLIELKPISQKKIDSLLIRSVSQTVRNARIGIIKIEGVPGLLPTRRHGSLAQFPAVVVHSHTCL